MSGCEGDYDGEEMQITDAQQRLDAAGCAYLIYTTPSHTRPAALAGAHAVLG